MTDQSPIAQAHAAEDIGSNPTDNPRFADVLDARFGRRGMLQGLLASAGLAALGAGASSEALAQGGSTLTFKEIKHSAVTDPQHYVPEGHQAQTLIRWGDKVAADAPAFNVNAQTAAAQEKQFGYNCDFVGYLPLPVGSQNSENGLLFVNHEYTNTNLMFAGLGEGRDMAEKITREQADVELSAHGAAIVEIRKTGNTWQVVENSRYNRRISALTTPMAVSGPARGHDRLKTSADPFGNLVTGTINNCAGGITPWGTVLTAEENFNQYFMGPADTLPQAASYKRYGVSGKSPYGWGRFHDRFDLAKEPNEPNRFGWLVEIDPYEPDSMPVKRTALGRFKHEGADIIVNKDGRVVVYSGDDERFDYVYRFVSAGRYDAANRRNNLGLLDQGTMSVARYNADGTLNWLPLVHGQGPLNAANGFASQADVLIDVRRAADLVGATKMDRPEDIETNPTSGHVFLMLTNNTSRKAEQIDKSNPRASNAHGHIVEMIPPGANTKDLDHAADTFNWTLFLLAGDPKKDNAMYHAGTSDDGWLSCPDNCAFDAKGRIWIVTDGAPTAAKIADCLYAADTVGAGRALTRLFYQGPAGAEVSGPAFTPDNSTLFLAIQHPGEDKGSTFETPSTRWPDFQAGMPPRPSVIAITRNGGGAIG